MDDPATVCTLPVELQTTWLLVPAGIVMFAALGSWAYLRANGRIGSNGEGMFKAMKDPRYGGAALVMVFGALGVLVIGVAMTLATQSYEWVSRGSYPDCDVVASPAMWSPAVTFTLVLAATGLIWIFLRTDTKLDRRANILVPAFFPLLSVTVSFWIAAMTTSQQLLVWVPVMIAFAPVGWRAWRASQTPTGSLD